MDLFLANSRYIARRIRKVYRREATVVWPPVAVQDFVQGTGARDGYLVASRFTPYKRVELIAEAFARMPDKALTIIGAGDSAALVERAAQGAPNITLLPPVPRETLIAAMQGARAMLFAAEEDFGITMVEAQACGTPLIAYGAAGACDIVVAQGTAPTGVLFAQQTPEAIMDAVRRFEADGPIAPAACRENALRFSEELFRQRFLAAVEAAMRDHAMVPRVAA